MSLWAKAQQLQGDALQQVRAVYGEHFPIEVRHFLAPWIEEKMWYAISLVLLMMWGLEALVMVYVLVIF